MAFIRVKKIKGHPYAYLVENTWKGQGSRQRVTGYLGKVLEIPATHSAPAPNMGGDYRSCIEELTAWHLLRLGFTRKDSLLRMKKLSFSLADMGFIEDEKPIALALKHHNGFFCAHTLLTLREFKHVGSEHEAGLALAKAVVDTGMDIPKELFVALFGKAMQWRAK